MSKEFTKLSNSLIDIDNELQQKKRDLKKNKNNKAKLSKEISDLQKQKEKLEKEKAQAQINKKTQNDVLDKAREKKWEEENRYIDDENSLNKQIQYWEKKRKSDKLSSPTAYKEIINHLEQLKKDNKHMRENSGQAKEQLRKDIEKEEEKLAKYKANPSGKSINIGYPQRNYWEAFENNCTLAEYSEEKLNEMKGRLSGKKFIDPKDTKITLSNKDERENEKIKNEQTLNLINDQKNEIAKNLEKTESNLNNTSDELQKLHIVKDEFENGFTTSNNIEKTFTEKYEAKKVVQKEIGIVRKCQDQTNAINVKDLPKEIQNSINESVIPNNARQQIEIGGKTLTLSTIIISRTTGKPLIPIDKKIGEKEFNEIIDKEVDRRCKSPNDTSADKAAMRLSVVGIVANVAQKNNRNNDFIVEMNTMAIQQAKESKSLSDNLISKLENDPQNMCTTLNNTGRIEKRQL